jgi:hypothetical protein
MPGGYGSEGARHLQEAPGRWVANGRGQVRRDRRPSLCDQRGLSGSRPRAADDLLSGWPVCMACLVWRTLEPTVERRQQESGRVSYNIQGRVPDDLPLSVRRSDRYDAVPAKRRRLDRCFPQYGGSR